MDWNSVEERFPAAQKYIWLNNAGTTPAGRFAVEAVSSYMSAYAEAGMLQDRVRLDALKRGIQTILGRLVGAEPEDIALVRNTSEGMNLVSHGLRLREGDRILLLEQEYPSNVYPWEHWKTKGVSIGFIPTGRTPDEFLENLTRALTPSTRLVSISAVHWCTGMPLPVRKTAALCVERGVELAVDGAQGVGHVELDMRWGVSFMAFSAWKWLLGPLGLGALVIPRAKLGLLDPVFKGTESVTDERTYFPYRDTLKPTAERYMYSTASFLDWVYFHASLEFLDRIGFPAVTARIHRLARLLASGLEERGFRVLASNHPGTPTGIIAAEKHGLDASRAVGMLLARGVVSQERLGRIRLSPHVYLTEDRIRQALTVFDELSL